MKLDDWERNTLSGRILTPFIVLFILIISLILWPFEILYKWIMK